MTRPNLAGTLLRLRLALARASMGTLLAGVLMLGAAALWLVLSPGLAARVDEHVRAVAQARSAPLPKPVVSAQTLASAHLKVFYAALGSSGHTEQVVTRLFDAASDAAVVLDKAEYKPGHESAGRFDTYTIILPVKGDYAHLRRFCQKVLLAIPYAALEDMRFTRNSANDQAVEASLRFTVFLRPDTGAWVPSPAFKARPASSATSASVPSPASGARALSYAASASASASVQSPASGARAASAAALTSASALLPPLPPSMARSAVVEVQR